MSDFKSNNSSEFIAAGGLVHGYTVIPNQIMNDIQNITSDGFTVLAKIFQYINNPQHKISVQGLSKQTGLSKDRTSKALKKLIEAGYIVRIPKKRGNLIAGYIYQVYDKPQTETIENATSCRNPYFQDTEGQDTNIQDTNIQDANNTNTNKENINNKSICTTQKKSVVVDINPNIRLIEERTHLKAMSDNMKKKASKWDTDRLIKAIDIFIQKEGVFFSLLEKIYKDDRNYVKQNETAKNGTESPKEQHYKTGVRVHETFRDYTPDELEKLLLESQKGKF